MKIRDVFPPSLNYKREILAGATTFIASSYIIFVNPLILQDAGMPYGALVTSTVLVAFFCTFLMGLVGKNPILVAPGMGLNAFFTYTLVGQLNLSFAEALGTVFWSGVIFVLLSLTPARDNIAKSIPTSVRQGTAAGIGLFITLIGLSKGEFIVGHPKLFFEVAPFQPNNITFLVGLFLTALLVVRETKGGPILGIIFSSVIFYGLHYFVSGSEAVAFAPLDNLEILSMPDFQLVGKLDYSVILQTSLWASMFALFFSDLFDSLSTFMGVCQAGELFEKDGKTPKNLSRSLTVDAWSTMVSALFGTSSATSFVESAAGVQAGGRTGLTSIASSLFFLPFLFLAPLLALVPAVAIAPMLVLVGPFMLKSLKDIDWNDFTESIPAFISLSFIPFTYSISQGVIWGILSWTFLKLLTGHYKNLTFTHFVINVFCIIFIVLK